MLPVIIRQTLPKAWNKLVSEPDELLVDLIAEATEKLCGYRPDNSDIENFISSYITVGKISTEIPRAKEPIKLSPVTGSDSYIGKSVTAFVFKNTRYEVKYWIEILTQICKLMYNLHHSDFDKVLQLQGRKRPYFTRNPDELRIPQQVENSGIYMETNLNSNSIMRTSLSIITLFGYSEKDFTVNAQ